MKLTRYCLIRTICVRLIHICLFAHFLQCLKCERYFQLLGIATGLIVNKLESCFEVTKQIQYPNEIKKNVYCEIFVKIKRK